jgi:hypothetical protein
MGSAVKVKAYRALSTGRSVGPYPFCALIVWNCFYFSLSRPKLAIDIIGGVGILSTAARSLFVWDYLLPFVPVLGGIRRERHNEGMAVEVNKRFDLLYGVDFLVLR